MNKRNYNALDDDALLAMAADGDKAAEEALLYKYKNLVRAKARAYFLVGADADDTVQEGMIGLYKAIRDYRHEKNDNFRAFAELCITRQLITAVKTSLRNKHAPLNSYISLNKTAFDNDSDTTVFEVLTQQTANDPEKIIIDNESLAETRGKILKRLSKFEQTVFELFLDGCSYTEIAEKTSKGIKSIDNALQRIKKKVADAMLQPGIK